MNELCHTATRFGTAWIAYRRLMFITGVDRIRCRDGRFIWYGD